MKDKKDTSTKSAIITGEYIVSLINSITKVVEERVLLEDNVKGIIREAETLSSCVQEMSHDKRKKLLIAYSRILEEIKNNVDVMVRELE